MVQPKITQIVGHNLHNWLFEKNWICAVASIQFINSALSLLASTRDDQACRDYVITAEINIFYQYDLLKGLCIFLYFLGVQILFNNIKNPNHKTVKFLCLASDSILNRLECYSKGKPYIFVQRRKMRRRIPKSDLINQASDVDNSDSEYEDFDSELKFSDFEADFFCAGILDKIVGLFGSLKSNEFTLLEQESISILLGRAFKQRPELFVKARYLLVFFEALKGHSFHEKLESVLLFIMEYILLKFSENRDLGVLFMLFSCSTQYFICKKAESEATFLEGDTMNGGEKISKERNLTELIEELISNEDTSILNWLMTKLNPWIEGRELGPEDSQKETDSEPFYLKADNNARKTMLNRASVSRILNLLGLELEKENKIWTFNATFENKKKLSDGLDEIKNLLEQDVAAHSQYDFLAPTNFVPSEDVISDESCGKSYDDKDHEMTNELPLEVEDYDGADREIKLINPDADTEFSKRRKRMKFLLEKNKSVGEDEGKENEESICNFDE